MIDTVLWIALIIVALAVGAYIGYQIRVTHGPQTVAKLHRDYLIGLNFLLNEQPDKAVDIFIKMLKVDQDTIETHIALGNLFRRRGEVDRALRIHQNLVERQTLDHEQRVHALFELGQDYLNAGMFDRAEKIFIDVIRLDATHVAALQRLLEIYQQEKDWVSAATIAKKLELATGKSMVRTIAHYYCEYAEVQHAKKEMPEALKALDTALEIDKNCIRASLLQGQYYSELHDYKLALKSLKRVKAQDPLFLSEAIEMIVRCFEALKDEAGLLTYLKQCQKECPDVPFVLILSDRILQWRGEKAATRFVADYVRHYPSFRGLKRLIELQLPQTEGKAKQDLSILKKLVESVVQDRPHYRCGHCGFAGRLLHWQCIGCKRWGMMHPIQGVEVGSHT